MKQRNITLAGFALLSAMIVAGCDSDKKASTAKTGDAPSMGMMNTKCPYSGEPVNSAAKTANYDGHTVGFCCNNCEAKWEKASSADKAKMWASCCPTK